MPPLLFYIFRMHKMHTTPADLFSPPLRVYTCRLSHAILGLGLGFGSQPVVLVDIHGLPWVADPLVANCPGSKIPAVDDVVRQDTFLLLVLVLLLPSLHVS
jgi:hypothetical protein